MSIALPAPARAVRIERRCAGWPTHCLREKEPVRPVSVPGSHQHAEPKHDRCLPRLRDTPGIAAGPERKPACLLPLPQHARARSRQQCRSLAGLLAGDVVFVVSRQPHDPAADLHRRSGAVQLLGSGIVGMAQQGWVPLAVVVGLQGVLLPFLRFGLLSAALATIRFDQRSHGPDACSAGRSLSISGRCRTFS